MNATPSDGPTDPMSSSARAVQATPMRPKPVTTALGRLALLVLAVVLLDFGLDWLRWQTELEFQVSHGELSRFLVLAAVIAFVIAMALPFVPGIEIGIALMLALGSGGIVLVYLSTQIALALSFALGRTVPRGTIARFCAAMRLRRAQRMFETVDIRHSLAELPGGADAGSRRESSLLRHRYLALALLLNLPGNAVLGGAGGVGMLAGMSGLFPFTRYMLLMALATTPVPLLLLISGGW